LSIPSSISQPKQSPEEDAREDLEDETAEDDKAEEDWKQKQRSNESADIVPE
jgi:hypothetical protein